MGCLATKEVETDARRLSQRRKEIGYGKNTLGYDRYRKMVPKEKRKRGDPQTPDVTVKVSKRQFDGIVRAWRRKLHDWDPPPTPVDDDEKRDPGSTNAAVTVRDSEDDDDLL